MLEIQKRKEHKSLWEDEEEKEQVSATEEANNTEAFADGPEVVDVETTISNATGSLIHPENKRYIYDVSVSSYRYRCRKGFPKVGSLFVDKII